MRILLSLIARVTVPIVILGGLVALVLLWPKDVVQGPSAGEWTCSMHPQIRQATKGQCPLCGMDLTPVSQVAELRQIEKRAGIEVEPIGYRELFKEIRTVGKLDYNESRVAYITARIGGRVDRVFADFTGIQVKEGDHLVDIYSPELLVAQGELLRALESFESTKGDRSFADANLEAARTKLRLLGIVPEQMASIERTRKTNTHLTIYATMGGTVIEKTVRAGQYVKEGDPLYRIADLDPIWLYLDIYEHDLGWVRYGQPVDVIVEAYPTETFHGLVTFIDPFLDDRTRTVKVRVNLKNADRKLKPAMYASARIRIRIRADGTPEPTGLEGKYICPMHPEVVVEKPGNCPICGMKLERVPEVKPAPDRAAKEPTKLKSAPKPGQVLALRASAVLDTGKRQIVYRQRKDDAYELVEVVLGPRTEVGAQNGKSESFFPVLKGLQDGDRVVIHGGFLLDSQQQISGMPSLLFPQGQSGASLHSGHGGTPTPAKPDAGHKH